MTRCVCHVDPAAVPSRPGPGELHVLLHGARPAQDGTAAIGAGLRDLYRSFGVQPSAAAVDLVSIALAVTAADTFVLRRKADNGWSRRLDVELPLCAPEPWEEARPDLERLLSFLSGDSWSFGFGAILEDDRQGIVPGDILRRVADRGSGFRCHE